MRQGEPQPDSTPASAGASASASASDEAPAHCFHPTARTHAAGAGLPLPDAPEELARERRRREAGMLDGLVDAHTHLFPESFYRALARWFDANLWGMAFRGGAEDAVEALRRGGTKQMVALVYAHKPGAAAYLNEFLAGLCRATPGVVGVGTVLPGEPGAREIVREAVEKHGLRGIKLHCHVQRVAVDDPRVLEVLSECAALGVPAVVHSGREPSSAGYGVDTRAICNVERTRRALRAVPGLTLVVPHVGADEFGEYLGLLDEFERLYLDTSMVCAEYLAPIPVWGGIEAHADRVMYGSDFPIIPYELSRESTVLARRIESDEALEKILRGTAKRLWRLP